MSRLRSPEEIRAVDAGVKVVRTAIETSIHIVLHSSYAGSLGQVPQRESSRIYMVFSPCVAATSSEPSTIRKAVKLQVQELLI
jgi:hypothetical protein